jgi:hypothetical protein
MRAAVSVELPAANGTTTVTDRVGQVSAEAGTVAPMAANVQNAKSARRNGIHMMSSWAVDVCRTKTVEKMIDYPRPE